MVCHGRQTAIRPLYLPRSLITPRQEYMQYAEYTPNVVHAKRDVLLCACGLDNACRSAPCGALNIPDFESTIVDPFQ